MPGPLAAITLTPSSSTLAGGATQQFTAVGTDANGTVVAITPTWSVVANGGTISSAGLFTAGMTAGTFTNTIQATSGAIAGHASVTVTITAPPLASITLTPSSSALEGGATQQFTAVGTDANGTVVAITPTWSVAANGGTISSAGLFTAGMTAGTFTNTVRAASGTIAGYASVTVTITAPPLASITLTPSSSTLAGGATQQFTAVGMDANGTVIAITPTWSVVANGGSISAAGLFTAGTIAGTYTNTVRAMSGAIAGYASVTVTITTPPVLDLGVAASYGVLAGSTTTCVDLGVVDADLGVSPGTAVTGFPPCTVSGAIHAGDATAAAAQTALAVTYGQLVAMPCGTTLSTDLGGQTLAPGVYCSTSTMGLTGEMFLDAQGDPNAIFVFQVGSALTTATAQVTLLNGAQAKNVYWQIGSSATLGVGSAMKGNILASASITLNDNATLLGRALAQHGAVTLGTGNVISLSSVPGPLAAITLTPSSSTLAGGATQQFTAVGTDANGTVVAITPTWSVVANGGTISSAGLFTAGMTAGTFTNTIQATSGAIAGHASVTVTITAPPLASITLTPSSSALEGGATQQFTAVGTDANGTVVAITPTWSVAANGGTISSAGLFTAGMTAGTFTNTVRAASGTIAGYASVTVTITAPPLASITLTPGSSTLAGGATQQFTAVGMDANGTVIAITPTWSVVASGGSISAAGLFTAGTIAGTYTNTVRAMSGAIAGYASVTVTITAPPLASITLTPSSSTLAGNATQQFTAVGMDANGDGHRDHPDLVGRGEWRQHR